MQAYLHSKASAERAAWDWSRLHQRELVTVLPPLVLGPMLHRPADASELNESSALIYQ